MRHNPDTSKKFDALLRSKALRITAQRKAILNVLDERGEHLTAEEIFEATRKLDTQINLATIYRTLTTLKESGLVQQFYVSPDHSESRFQLVGEPPTDGRLAAPANTHNLHFHCSACGKIIILDDSELIDTVLTMLQKQLDGLEIKRICMCAEGRCPTCTRAAR